MALPTPGRKQRQRDWVTYGNETVDTVVSDAAIAEHTPSPHSNKVLGSDLLVGVFLCDVYVLLVPAEVQRHPC